MVRSACIVSHKLGNGSSGLLAFKTRPHRFPPRSSHSDDVEFVHAALVHSRGSGIALIQYAVRSRSRPSTRRAAPVIVLAVRCAITLA